MLRVFVRSPSCFTKLTSACTQPRRMAGTASRRFLPPALLEPDEVRPTHRKRLRKSNNHWPYLHTSAVLCHIRSSCLPLPKPDPDAWHSRIPDFSCSKLHLNCPS